MWNIIKIQKLVKEARILARQQQWARASSAYQEIIKKAPNNYKLIVQYAHCLKEAGEQSAALATYKSAIELDPLEYDAYLYAADMEYERGDIEAAKIFYIQSLAGMPHNKATLDKLRKIIDDEFEIELLLCQEYIKRLSTASVKKTNNILYKLLRNIARSCARSANWKSSGKYYVWALKFLSKNDWNERHKLFLQLGHCSKELGKLDVAEFYYRKSSSYDPTDFEVYTHLGQIKNNKNLLLLSDFLKDSQGNILNILSKSVADYVNVSRSNHKSTDITAPLLGITANKICSRLEGVANKGRRDIILSDITRHLYQGNG
ncbi:tetratricopeptide repeat protein [Gluconobacter wancherniae]|uniref:tetratricopeptide repeat protein n=1 Tax=Gluconobacter wancherniae TaxID=1307955 RepID=UPI001B8CD828|nr:tetratricopeptide repeat protein [Gluconobacter wancherniae]